MRTARVAVPGSRLHLQNVDLTETIRQTHAFRPVQHFTLRTSGLVAVLHSDGSVTARPQAVDEVMHANLRLWHTYADPQLRSWTRCYAEQIIDGRAFAGRIVHLYVPASPRMCLQDLRLVRRNDGAAWHEACDWGGVTPPVRIAGFLGELSANDFHILVAPGITRWDNARPNPLVARTLAHEAHHLWDWVMGHDIAIVADERRARIADAIVAAHHGKELPNPFAYPP